MNIPVYYVIALMCALIGALGQIMLKKATGEGIGITRLAFVSNWITLIIFLPLFFLWDGDVDWSRIHWPFLTSLTAFGGMLLTYLALKLGDVSVVTPIMGSKAIFVALFSIFMLTERVTGAWWIGAGLTAVAVYLLGGQGELIRKLNFPVILTAMAAVAAFGLNDVLIQLWASDFGFIEYVLLSTIFIALESFVLVPFFHAPLKAVSRKAWWWTMGGTGLLSVQWLMLAYCYSSYGKATGINIVYSSRGLWSIALVWAIGPLLGNQERLLGHRIMFRRLTGALILCLAIVLVLLEEK